MTKQTPISSTSTIAKARKRSVWGCIGPVILFVFIALVLLLLWAWYNRTNLAEKFVINALAQDGINIGLDITELSSTRIILQHVKMSHEKQTFFEAENVTATYLWREAMDGKIKRIIFDNAKVKITIDEKGQIIDGWLPPGLGNSSDSGNSFPPEGLSLKNSHLSLETPYGEMNLSGDMEATDKNNFFANFILPETHLTQNSAEIVIEARATVAMQDGQITSSGHMTLPSLAHPVIDGTNINLTYNGYPDFSSPQKFKGKLSATFDNITSAQVILGKGILEWDGILSRAAIGLDVDGDWTVDLDALTLPDPVRVKDIAQKISLSQTLSKTPIATEFVPGLESALVEILTQSAISASGNVKRNSSGVILHLNETAHAQTKNRLLKLAPKPNIPTYQFNRNAQIITSQFDLSLSSPGRLEAKDVVFKASSLNGYRIDGVETFAAQIKTSKPWENKKTPATLRPFEAKVIYKGNRTTTRNLSLSGTIDYDGPIPGGIATGLQASGDLQVNLTDEQIWVDFKPVENDIVRFQQIDTVTDWTAHDISTRLAAAMPLYSRKGDETEIFADLSELRLQAARVSDPANLEISTQTARLEGLLQTKGQRLSQIWNIDFKDAKIASEDLPGPGTRLELGDGTLNTQLTTDEIPEFTLSAPHSQIETPLIKAIDISLDVAGTPDNYTILHDKGRVKVNGNDLPPLPVKGEILAQNGAFNGNAKAFLPQADNTPVIIDYNIKDSRGTATVDIDALKFTPGGLQPQDLISALSGKIAQVEGQASARIFLTFGANEPFKSYGSAKLEGMNFATAPGPLSNVSTELDLASVLPLKTRGRQTLTVKSFDPGLPLENGIIEYELIEGGIKVYSARWPIGDGYFSLDPFTWLYSTEENRMTLRLEKIDLGEFINNLGNGALKATGELEGALPIVISGINVSVEDGIISVPDGGRIQYAAAEAESLSTEVSPYAGAAMETLRDFYYDELYAKMNGPLDGEIIVGVKFQGNNEKVLNGQPFAFDVTISGELFNILRSFDSSEHIKSTAMQSNLPNRDE